jgi:hypothetical protein
MTAPALLLGSSGPRLQEFKKSLGRLLGPLLGDKVRAVDRTAGELLGPGTPDAEHVPVKPRERSTARPKC